MSDPRDPLVLLTPAKRRQAGVLDVSRSLALIAVAGTPFFSQQVNSAPPRKPNYPVWTAPNLLHSSFAPEPTTQIRIAYLSNLQVKNAVTVDVPPNSTILMGYVPPVVTFPAASMDDFQTPRHKRRVSVDNPPNTLLNLLPAEETILLPAFQQDDFCHYVPRKRRVDVQYAPNFVINQPPPLKPFGLTEWPSPVLRKPDVDMQWAPNVAINIPPVTKPFNQNVWDSTQLSKTRYQVDYYYNGVLMPTAGPPIPPVPPADDATSGGIKRPWREKIPTRPPLKEAIRKTVEESEKSKKKETVSRETKPKTLTKQQLEVTQEQAIADATKLRSVLDDLLAQQAANQQKMADMSGHDLLIATQQAQLDEAKAELVRQEIELNDVIFVVKTVLQLI